jgi:hypothetical protein
MISKPWAGTAPRRSDRRIPAPDGSIRASDGSNRASDPPIRASQGRAFLLASSFS